MVPIDNHHCMDHAGLLFRRPFQKQFKQRYSGIPNGLQKKGGGKQGEGIEEGEKTAEGGKERGRIREQENNEGS